MNRNHIFMIGAIVGACGLAMVQGVVMPDGVRPAASLETAYAFRLPVQWMGCLEYQLSDDEVFGNWWIQQPFVLSAVHTKNVRIQDIYVEVGEYCGAAVHLR